MKFAPSAIAMLMVLGLCNLSHAADKPAKKSKADGATRFTGPAGKTYTFKETSQGKLEIEAYFPKDWKASDKRAGVVFFFGGGWAHGSRNQFAMYSDYLAQRGMVALTADYRIKSKHNTTPAESLEDAKSAIRWTRAHAAELGIDPDRLAAGGGSAGGHLAAATSMCDGFDLTSEDQSVSSKPNALLLFNPVFDLTGADISKVVLPDGKPQDVAVRAKALSPIFGVTAKTPPAIVFYGTADTLCEQGRAFLAKSATSGNRAELYTAEGQKHGFFNNAPWQNVALRQTDEFLVSIGYLKGDPTVAADKEHELKQEKAAK